jgi:hypothetical protein
MSKTGGNAVTFKIYNHNQVFGAICGENQQTISNCTVKNIKIGGTINNDWDKLGINVGLLCGKNYRIVDTCIVKDSTMDFDFNRKIGDHGEKYHDIGYAAIGGLVGQLIGGVNCTISDCLSSNVKILFDTSIQCNMHWPVDWTHNCDIWGDIYLSNLIGTSNNNPSVSKCVTDGVIPTYSISHGHVSINAGDYIHREIGYLVGKGDGEYDKCYACDVQNTSNNLGNGINTTNNKELSEGAMNNLDNYSGLTKDKWSIVNGHPILKTTL